MGRGRKEEVVKEEDGGRARGIERVRAPFGYFRPKRRETKEELSLKAWLGGRA